MKLYHRYFLKKITGSFVAIATILICLIWFTKTISFIKYITENGIALSDFLYIFILILPWLILLIIPISLFIAVLAAYNSIINHNELTILKNAGLSKFYLIKPVILIALMCCLLCYMMSLYFMPMANKKLKLARENFRYNYANIMISPGIFESLNDLTIYVQDRDSQNKLLGILIYDNGNKDYSTTITAENGHINQNNGSVLLHLNSGTVQKFNFITQKSDILKFDSYIINLNENQQQEANIKWSARERYISELLNPAKDSSELDLMKYRAELHERITYPLFSLVLSLIAVSFLLQGQFNRKGNMAKNLTAVVVATLFMGSIMLIYDIIGKSATLVPLLYLDLVIFTAISLYILKSNHRKIT